MSGIKLQMKLNDTISLRQALTDITGSDPLGGGTGAAFGNLGQELLQLEVSNLTVSRRICLLMC